MNKEHLLKNIAEAGYNVGFAAKKHFATYDIVSKVPALIGFLSTAVGIFALYIETLSTKSLSAAFIVLGLIGLNISHYNHKKEDYSNSGKKITDLFNALKLLYFNVKGDDSSNYKSYEDQLIKINKEYSDNCISEQILFSDWYAHYKFFWQQQIEWIDEQKSFKFFRDKIPLSLSISIVILIIITIFLINQHF